MWVKIHMQWETVYATITQKQGDSHLLVYTPREAMPIMARHNILIFQKPAAETKQKQGLAHLQTAGLAERRDHVAGRQ